MNPIHRTFYVHPAWRRVGALHTPLLNPWWGNPYSDASLFTKQLFDTYTFDTSLYTITDDSTQADLVLAPYPHSWYLRHGPELLDACIRVAEEAQLPILVDGLGDVEYPIPASNAYVLRYGGYRFLPEKGRIQIPLFADDLLERYRGGHLEVRTKREGRPVVGFAAWAHLSMSQRIRTLLKEAPLRLRSIVDPRYRVCTKGVLWREKAIRLLTNTSLVDFHYHARNTFSGTVKTAEGDMRALQTQMVETILDSDYALDVKGDANNSARLFEILSLGRIPVIVDTERNFPFSDTLDYSTFALVVSSQDMDKLPEQIARFHQSISSEKFEQMQRTAREVYRHYFRVDALTQHMLKALPKPH